MGRPTKLTPELKEQIFNSARVIYHYKWVAASVGISEKTLERWREANPDFDGQLDQARSDFIRDNLKKARPDFKLETADREIFGKQQEVKVTGNAIQAIIDKFGDSEGVDEVPPITADEKPTSEELS
jgi:transposase-like protein